MDVTGTGTGTGRCYVRKYNSMRLTVVSGVASAEGGYDDEPDTTTDPAPLPASIFVRANALTLDTGARCA